MVLQLPRHESFMDEAVNSGRRPPNLGPRVQDKSPLAIVIVIVICLEIVTVFAAAAAAVVVVGIMILN